MSAPSVPGAAGADAEAPPVVVRRLRSPAALALADLAAQFDDLQTTLRCCERLIAELTSAGGPLRGGPLAAGLLGGSPGGGGPDDLTLEAFWTTAVLSYARCFAAGERGTGLTEADITAAGLEGDVLGWHRMLLQMRDRYVDPATNPRESFSVGASQDSTGHAQGIAVTSGRTNALDEVSVRQTGAIAYKLSALVDERLAAQQALVLKAAGAMARPALDKLPLLHVVVPDQPVGVPG